jgi:hypothetical protein
MVWYILENTLSPHGTVNRWVCEVNNWKLSLVQERLKIAATGDNKTAQDQEWNIFPLNSVVSMNFWWFHKDQIEVIHSQFNDFIQEYGSLPKKEWFIPTVVESLMKNNWYQCDVIVTTDPWCWVSYKEDKPFVQKMIQKAVSDWIYPKQWIWSVVS